MRYSFTIVLAILTVLVCGTALVHTGSKYRDSIFGTPPIATGEKLFSLEELDSVKSITLSKSSGAATTVKLEGKDWNATSPWKDRADKRYIDYLFQFTVHLRVHDSVPREGLDLHEFGLREGSTRVTMRNDEGDRVCDFFIGRVTACHVSSDDGKKLHPTIYIRFARGSRKGTIYLCTSQEGVTETVQSLFHDDFFRFRDHHPLLFSPLQIDQITLKNQSNELLLTRPPRSPHWSISKPIELRADNRAVISLMNHLTNLTALKVEDRANVTLPTAGEVTQQAQVISLRYLDSGETVTLHIYPPANKGDTTTLATVSNRPDCVFHLPIAAAQTGNSSIADLQLGVDELRSKNMMHMNPRQLKTIVIRPTGRAETILTRGRATTWRVLNKEGLVATNEDSIINLLTAVTKDRVQRFVTDAATDFSLYGLQRPALRMVFINFSGDSVALSIGSPDGKNIYAHEAGKPNIWQISNATLGKISTHPWQWRTNHVWHLPKVDIEQIKIERKGSPTALLDYAFFSEKWTATRDGQDATASLN
ncbi:MAG: DUF4340 domain-containing protein, partial [Akkermansiaceae bacterium]